MNTIEMAKIYQQELDKQVVVAAVTGFMEENAGQVKYNGGNEIKIPKISMDGLGTYDRSNGYTDGSVTLAYETHVLTQDRGRSFSIDTIDVNESNFVAAAGNLMSQFQATRVIPEIDAYRISKIASQAISAGKNTNGYVANASDILAQLKADIVAIKDVAGDIELVIMMATPVLAVLEQADQLTRFLNVGTLEKAGIETQVKSIDGNIILPVPSARMKTAYVFNDGKTAGQEAGGFAPADSARNVNWVIIPRHTPIAISKTDVIRIFDPMQNQAANAWKIDYRKYHDIFIPDNQLEVVKVNIKEV